VVEQADDLAPTARADDLGIQVESSTVQLPGSTFDAAKVIARAGSLFPFLTRRPFLDRAAGRSRGARLVWPDPTAEPAAETIAPTLSLTDAAIQRLIDESWSRRDRWKAFGRIASIANRYDADAGSLPPLLRQYEIQNGLQPYVDQQRRDPRLWVELGLAADHADFLDFMASYATSHPRTAGRTDALFLLDKIVQGNVDALVTLLDTVPDEDLQWTRQQNARAFDAIVAIQRYYVVLLQQRGLGTRRALTAYYDDLRLRMLADILDTTPNGYRANDARFLIGGILWRQGRASDALAAWTRLDGAAAADEYAPEYTQLARLVRTSPAARVDVLQINQILRAARGRWLSFSATRLRHFGYHFDTY